jgi:uncharacterized damage-inducible protein DinB
MEIKNIQSFLTYYEKTREATLRLLAVVPSHQWDWTYQTGKFTIADVVRHIASIERNVFAEMVIGRPSAYIGCGKELADGPEQVMHYFNTMHAQSMQIFGNLTDANLVEKIKTLDGREVEAGSFLRALVLHEIHHRAALYIYLNILGVKTPPVIGFTEEQVVQLSKKINI